MKTKNVISILIIPLSFMLVFIPIGLLGNEKSSFPSGDLIKQPVNDYTGYLRNNEKKEISELIVSHFEKTGVQIAVLIIESTGDYSIEEFSLKVANEWKGGSSKRNDGLLYTMAISDRRMRIEVGYGLTGYIPDNVSLKILEDSIQDFRDYKYGSGVLKIVRKLADKTGSLRQGEDIPLSAKIRGFLFRIVSFYAVFFLIGTIIGFLFLWGINKFKIKITLLISCGIIVWIVIPVIIQIFFPGVWGWRMLMYLAGTLGGLSIAASFRMKKAAGKIISFIISLIPASIIITSSIYFLNILRPDPFGETRHETYMALILFFVGFSQFMVWLFVYITAIEGWTSNTSSGYGDSYSSDAGSSSTSSSSSSTSGDSSWTGGGGSFGGGGSSSSW